jgi:succinate dehydrogenase / fumarate reductase, cytochrome b subunit
MSKRAMPLSPFLIYRWQYSNFLSILNRATGLYLSIGLPLLIYWLVSVAAGPESYEKAQAVFAHPLTVAALVAWSASFFFHLLNGLRHLAWDVGYGFERKVARATGWTVFVGAVLLTALCWVLIAMRLHAASGGSV